MGKGIMKTIKQQFGLVTRLSCMCVRGRGLPQRGVGAEEMEWGSSYLSKVFEEWPGEVGRPWNGDPCSCCPH